MVEGESLWYVTNRWEVVCLDIGPLLRSEGAPKERWIVDLIKKIQGLSAVRSNGSAPPLLNRSVVRRQNICPTGFRSGDNDPPITASEANRSTASANVR
jgi:hypothetical protein